MSEEHWRAGIIAYCAKTGKTLVRSEWYIPVRALSQATASCFGFEAIATEWLSGSTIGDAQYTSSGSGLTRSMTGSMQKQWGCEHDQANSIRRRSGRSVGPY